MSAGARAIAATRNGMILDQSMQVTGRVSGGDGIDGVIPQAVDERKPFPHEFPEHPHPSCQVGDLAPLRQRERLRLAIGRGGGAPAKVKPRRSGVEACATLIVVICLELRWSREPAVW